MDDLVKTLRRGAREDGDKLLQSAADRITTLQAEADRWKAIAGEMAGAIEGLPVEDWVEQDRHGEPHLVGYVMQCQGEWDIARQSLSRYNEMKDGTPAQSEAPDVR